jgi:hypothetical protein
VQVCLCALFRSARCHSPGGRARDALPT